MDKIVTQYLGYAEKLLQEKKYDAAIAALGEIDFAAISPNDRAYYNLINIEANLSMGNYDVDERLHETLTHYKSRHDDNKYAWAKHLLGWLFMLRGNYIDARESLLESYILYKKCDSTKGQAWGLNRLSFIAYHKGDVHDAVLYLEKCIEIYEKIGETEKIITVSLNLAQLHAALGKLSESVQLYADMQRVTSAQNSKNTAIYYFMSAVPHALKGDIDRAKKSIERTPEYLDGFIREQAIYYENLGWIHLLEQKYQQAYDKLQKGLKIAIEIAPKSALVSQIKRRLADACLGLNRYDDARSYAGDALAVAEKINERVEIAACHRVRAQLAGHDGDAEPVRRWFKKATDLLSMIGSQYELAVTRYLAAVSGYYHNGERQALLYLARQYFESEDVRPYLEKIDHATEQHHAVRTPIHTSSDDGAPMIIHRDRAMQRLIDLARNVAPSNMAVLLTGATGTGKDLFARYIHHHSGRTGRFVSVNAAAIPENMVEAELFGFDKGAYTGAAKATSGWIEEADGGTFYLNEIADASPELQAKLLDVIETRRICRLGERRERSIDCRIIAASNRELDDLIYNNHFRMDLYHRLNEIAIELPPLDGRSGDIEVLMRYFLEINGIESNTIDANEDKFGRLVELLSNRSWPGNVRQVKIYVKRLALLSKGDFDRMITLASEHKPSEKTELLRVLNRTGWNRRETARILGVDEATVRRHIKKHHLKQE